MQKITAFLLTLISPIILVAPAYAQSASPKASLKPLRQAVCQAAVNKIDGRISYLNARKSLIDTRYTNVTTRVNGVITKASQNGGSTSKLQADLTTLAGLKSTFDSDFTSLISELNTAKSTDCTSTKWSTVRKQITTLHQKAFSDNKAIRNFYKNTLKPDLKTVRSSLKTNKNGVTTDINSASSQVDQAVNETTDLTNFSL